MHKKYKLVFLTLLIAGFTVIATRYLLHTNIPVLEPKGIIGQKELHLIVFALLLSLIVVVPVFVLLFTFAWRYREGNLKAKYSPNLDHSRIAETFWWLIPSALILVLSVVAWNSSHQLDPYKPIASKTKPLVIQVIALDWKWLFVYPGQNIASVNFFQFPVNTPIDFEITSDAPMNSFWIPQLGGQIYAMPGMSTRLYLMASQDGSFNGVSANISGSGFADMTFIAKASSRADFDRWTQQTKESTNYLTLAAYDRLAKPSGDNPVSSYSSVQTGLYNTEVMKYMIPAMSPTKPTSTATQSKVMSNTTMVNMNYMGMP